MPAAEIEKFMHGGGRKFHLFGCLNEVIFEYLKLSDNKREILNHQFGYSYKYERIQKSKLAKKQNITKSSVTNAAAVIKRKTDDAIKRFKFLEPYYSYWEKYKFGSGVTEVTAEMCERIRKEEAADGITPYFVARVFAVIYNLKLHGVPSGGEVVYWLVPRESGGRDIMQTPESEADKKSFERLFAKMGKEVEAMKNLSGLAEYMEIMDRMLKRGRKNSRTD
jgi:hypothetical protein